MCTLGCRPHAVAVYYNGLMDDGGTWLNPCVRVFACTLRLQACLRMYVILSLPNHMARTVFLHHRATLLPRVAAAARRWCILACSRSGQWPWRIDSLGCCCNTRFPGAQMHNNGDGAIRLRRLCGADSLLAMSTKAGYSASTEVPHKSFVPR